MDDLPPSLGSLCLSLWQGGLHHVTLAFIWMIHIPLRNLIVFFFFWMMYILLRNLIVFY